MKPQAWLPNVTGGVSIWRLAPDLNRPDLFDGRLLVPRTEGPPNLPTAVEWNLTGLVPIADAEPRAVADALADFVRCVERCSARIDADGSGFERYRGTLTLPALDSEHYFLDPIARTLRVRNWGARPRAFRQRTVVVIDYREFAAYARSHPLPDSAIASPSFSERRRRWWIVPAVLAAILAIGIFGAWARRPVPAQGGPAIEARPTEVDAGPDDAPDAQSTAPPPLPAPHQRILFELGNPAPSADQRASLDAIADYLARTPVRRVRIEGHADHRGAEPDNLALSLERARRVRQWLVERGIAPGRLAIAGCSERHPVSEEGASNRRVEFFVVEPPLDPAPHAGCVEP